MSCKNFDDEAMEQLETCQYHGDYTQFIKCNNINFPCDFLQHYVGLTLFWPSHNAVNYSDGFCALSCLAPVNSDC